MNNKPPLATSDFPAEHQAEAVAVADLQRNTAALSAVMKPLLAKDRRAIQEHLNGIADILSTRRGELESIAYTAQNPIPPFKRMY